MEYFYSARLVSFYGGADESYAASVHKELGQASECVEIDNPTNAGNLWHIAVDSMLHRYWRMDNRRL